MNLSEKPDPTSLDISKILTDVECLDDIQKDPNFRRIASDDEAARKFGEALMDISSWDSRTE